MGNTASRAGENANVGTRRGCEAHREGGQT